MTELFSAKSNMLTSIDTHELIGDLKQNYYSLGIKAKDSLRSLLLFYQHELSEKNSPLTIVYTPQNTLFQEAIESFSQGSDVALETIYKLIYLIENSLGPGLTPYYFWFYNKGVVNLDDKRNANFKLEIHSSLCEFFSQELVYIEFNSKKLARNKCLTLSCLPFLFFTIETQNKETLWVNPLLKVIDPVIWENSFFEGVFKFATELNQMNDLKRKIKYFKSDSPWQINWISNREFVRVELFQARCEQDVFDLNDVKKIKTEFFQSIPQALDVPQPPLIGLGNNDQSLAQDISKIGTWTDKNLQRYKPSSAIHYAKKAHTYLLFNEKTKGFHYLQMCLGLIERSREGILLDLLWTVMEVQHFEHTKDLLMLYEEFSKKVATLPKHTDEQIFLIFVLENILSLSFTPLEKDHGHILDILQFLRTLPKSDAKTLKQKLQVRLDLNQIIFPIDLYNK